MDDTITCDLVVADTLPAYVGEFPADTPVIEVEGVGCIIGTPEPVAWAQFIFMVAHERSVNDV